MIQQNYEVVRFIARGGMGEVYEGTNIHLEERLAIKVILPQWASKSEVVEQFRMEAGTLNKLQHDALVQYRNFIYDVQLDIFCLVTEFIDGDNLADVIDQVKPSPEELRALLIRLASGLQVAHGHGAIHRDMSPDNIILKDGRLDQAKIIDFGIAKDMNEDGKSIFGGGFAGKLAYAAPEQLGMFDRNMGEWSDVYSLALVIKAVARGEDLRLGATPADAVITRQKGIELDDVPEDLQPVLEQMLKADPAERLQTMGDVLSALKGSTPIVPPLLGKKSKRGEEPEKKSSVLPILLGAGGLVTVLLLGLVGYLFWPFGGGNEEPGLADGGGSAVAASPAAGDVVGVARQTFNSAAPNIDCSWLREVSITEVGGQVSLKLTGVALDPVDVQRQLTAELDVSGLSGANVDLGDVAQISRAGCNVLNAFRERQTVSGNRLEARPRRYELEPIDSGPNAGAPFADGLFFFYDLDSVEDYAILSIVPNGEITMVAASREVKETTLSELFTDVESGERITIGFYNEFGWNGVILVTGQGPFDEDLLAPQIGERGADWRRRFRETAAQRGWQIEMEWIELVDEQPD